MATLKEVFEKFQQGEVLFLDYPNGPWQIVDVKTDGTTGSLQALRDIPRGRCGMSGAMNMHVGLT